MTNIYTSIDQVLQGCSHWLAHMGMPQTMQDFQLVSFRDWRQLPKKPGVYVVFDSKNQTVAYVGMSYKGRGGIRTRNSNHNKKFDLPDKSVMPNGWHWYLKSYAVDPNQLTLLYLTLDSVYDICALEMNLIREFQPLANEESFIHFKREL